MCKGQRVCVQHAIERKFHFSFPALADAMNAYWQLIIYRVNLHNRCHSVKSGNRNFKVFGRILKNSGKIIF